MTPLEEHARLLRFSDQTLFSLLPPYLSLGSLFITLPVGVFGKVSVKSTDLLPLKRARFCLQKDSMSVFRTRLLSLPQHRYCLHCLTPLFIWHPDDCCFQNRRMYINDALDLPS